MTEIRFYHLVTKPLEQALPEILEKVLERGQRAIVKLPDEAAVKDLNAKLWTYKQQSFLPHGSKKDGNPENQPIWLTEGDDNPNDASLLFLVSGAEAKPEDISSYDLCCEMFDGQNEQQLQTARKHWTTYKEQKFDLAYWKQDGSGRWHKQDI